MTDSGRLTKLEALAAASAARGDSRAETARLVERSERQVRRILSRSHVAAEVQATRQQALSGAAGVLADAARDAATTLVRLLTPDPASDVPLLNTRLRAAERILDKALALSDHLGVLARVEALEAELAEHQARVERWATTGKTAP